MTGCTEKDSSQSASQMASKIVEIKKNTNFEVKNAWPVRDSVSLWGPFPAIPSPYPFLCFLLANDTLWGVCAGRPVYGSSASCPLSVLALSSSRFTLPF